MSYDLLDQEKVLIHSLLMGRDETKAYILRKYLPEHFINLITVYNYVRENMGLGNTDILTIDTLASNAIFEPPVRGIIASLKFSTLIDDPAQLEVMCKGLLDHYGTEYLLETLRAPLEKLQSGEVDYVTVLKTLQTDLEGASVKLFKDAVVPLGLGVGSNIEDTIQRVTSQENNIFIRTGFSSIDKQIGGFSRGDVIVLAAPSSHGKTLMMLSFAVNMIFNAKQPLSVLFVTMEVKDVTIAHRLVAQKLSMPLNQVKEITMPDEFLVEYLAPEIRERKLAEVQANREKVMSALRKFNEDLQEKGSKFDVKTYGSFSPDDLLRELALHPYDVVVLDYLNLMSSSSASEADWLRLSLLTRELKNIATSRDMCVITAQQLDEVKKEIRYSMAVKEHCDILIQWELPPEVREAQGGVLDMYFKKGRNVGTFTFNLNVDLACQRAYEADPDNPGLIDSPLAMPGSGFGSDLMSAINVQGILG